MTAHVHGGWVPADSFGQRLMLTRKALGLSVKEIALATGLHYATWSTWENGRLPSDKVDVARRLSETYGVDRPA
ncbi:MAG TPA: helix-turn-helix transcriptional regulator [Kribbellaceae bacterium]|nr:helix-turn-helix transcriptional regulator [Kribbellaceae bacterium]